MVKKTDMQVQEVQRVPNMMDAKRPTPRHNIIKRTKVKDNERLLKARKNKFSYLKFARWERGEWVKM